MARMHQLCFGFFLEVYSQPLCLPHACMRWLQEAMRVARGVSLIVRGVLQAPTLSLSCAALNLGAFDLH